MRHLWGRYFLRFYFRDCGIEDRNLQKKARKDCFQVVFFVKFSSFCDIGSREERSQSEKRVVLNWIIQSWNVFLSPKFTQSVSKQKSNFDSSVFCSPIQRNVCFTFHLFVIPRAMNPLSYFSAHSTLNFQAEFCLPSF